MNRVARWDAELPLLKQLSGKVASTGADVSETIDIINARVETVSQLVNPSIASREIAQLKEATVNLDSKFTELESQSSELIKFVRENAEIILLLQGQIPSLSWNKG